jgi:hypothetical protein
LQTRRGGKIRRKEKNSMTHDFIKRLSPDSLILPFKVLKQKGDETRR